jgi:RNA polymerase sigma-70 factor (ECF subfamily)
VARQPPSVREWNVSSEPALLQHPQVAGEAVESATVRFEDVFRRHAPYVGALILKLIGRPGDVDDLVQDVFLQAHRGLSKLREPEAVRPWLRRITVRRTQRWLRKRRVLRWFRESDIDSHEELADPSASPEDRATLAYVYRTLETMPRDERLAWVLRFVEGETLESIAELLGSSVSTVQRRLRAAEARMGEIR